MEFVDSLSSGFKNHMFKHKKRGKNKKEFLYNFDFEELVNVNLNKNKFKLDEDEFFSCFNSSLQSFKETSICGLNCPLVYTSS